ncbi:hypothetical protein MPER_09852 [Moniliophthora perniciosa FA553]|nr:hypothetical protein MPER_09852 [Moniliophthora perniciosa FA553]
MSVGGLVCQQCKEDASLVDLAPSAFDTIVASLPPPASTYARLKNDSIIRSIPTTPPNIRTKKGSIKAKTPPTKQQEPRQVDETKKERDGYIAFEKEVRKERERDAQGMSKEEAEKKIEKLKVEERMAVEQLVEAEREQQLLDEELRALEQEESCWNQRKPVWSDYSTRTMLIACAIGDIFPRGFARKFGPPPKNWEETKGF